MHRFAVVILLTLGAAPLARATPPAFSDAIADVTRRTVEVRDGFIGIAPLEVWHKAAKLESVERGDADVIARLEAVTPTEAHARCHADALDGARRADAAMKDMLRLYRAGEKAEAFGARITAAARNADNGLSALESALATCAR
jgi:hypothetical protein